MGLSVGEALEDGIVRLADGRQLGVFLGLYVAHLLLTVGTQSQLAAQRDQFGDDALFEEALLPDELPLALEMPVGVATLLWLLALVGLVAVSLVAFRTLLSSDAVGRPMALFVATANGVVAALVISTAVSFGLVLFVLPGLFLASALAFTYPYVAVDRTNVFEAMRRSWELTRGHRLRVFGVLVVTALGFFAISVVGGLLAIGLGAVPVLAELVNVAVGALAWLFTLSVLASAFDQLETFRTAEAEKWAGVDDELLP
ncbi:glycerophosphoryl diester phosphodiesterase membrane domain-containing protein [Natribaculum luteum]|uniref:Glycerophosphoryl diester phosphodiesterase membrane domain-containing protein n=1 Tax=Natribaculum luteum TaxID=1586232 RepID=A0ABD5P1Y7_9EURY|nr:glycerophosphoryl diester phosphodiesterase membrane domain-containing protein [Natribaculum luteum]